MKKILALFGLAFLFNFSQKSQKIEIGSKVPEFSLKDQNGKMFSMSTVIGKQNLVIYFYPKDDTPGCTKEACTFRDQYDKFVSAGAMVIGISGQSVESHKKFADKYHLNFTLLSDEKNEVRNLFGVPKTAMSIPGRVTYVADKHGKIVYIFNSMSEPEKHVEEALKSLKGL